MELHISIRDDDVASKLYDLLVALGIGRTASKLETRDANQGYDKLHCSPVRSERRKYWAWDLSDDEGALIPGDSFYGHATTSGAC
jgi:hypothetical protein